MALIDMTNISETDLAYAAGVIDSDGCISVNKSSTVQKSGSRSYMITVRVAQKGDEIPQWFSATFGGRCARYGKGKWTVGMRGTPTFFPPLYSWNLYCNDAADFLERIVPYMRLKRFRAETAIRLARMQKRRGGKGYRYGGREVTPEENSEREKLALLIRAENQKGNDRVAMTATWGVN